MRITSVEIVGGFYLNSCEKISISKDVLIHGKYDDDKAMEQAHNLAEKCLYEIAEMVMDNPKVYSTEFGAKMRVILEETPIDEWQDLLFYKVNLPNENCRCNDDYYSTCNYD